MPTTGPDPTPTRRSPKSPPGKHLAPPRKNPGRRMTRDELSRHEREVRATRMILAGMGALAVLVIGILGFGYWREGPAKGLETVAAVNGHSITLDEYARRLDIQQRSVQRQIAELQAQLQGFSGDADAGSIVELFRQEIQRLQLSLMLLPDQALDMMINEELVAQEAARRGLSVSAQEMDQETEKNFGDPPTPVPQPSPSAAPAAEGQPTATPAPTVTPSPAPTDGPSPTPLPTADVQARLNSVLTSYGISIDEYRAMVESQLLYQKLETAMGADLPTSEEQVHARHILLDSEEKAREILDRLKSGANFEELARAESKDTSNNEKGGDLGWFGRGRMVPEFDEAAFSLPLNQLSDPVKTTFGYHIIEVLEKDPNRKIDDAELASRKSAAVTTWLDSASAAPEVRRTLTEDQKAWVYRKIKWSPPSAP